jgi:1-acyl-sn-glycerol-3-phosphate acyltransferase
MAGNGMVQWVRDEWGVFGAADKLRWVRQWVPFGARTLGYGAISLSAGPLTSGRASEWAARRWSEVSTRKLGIELDVRGLEHVPAGSLVYASNHQSLIDILVLGATLDQDYKWAAKRSLMNIPVLGWHLRLAGHVPVDRQAGRDAAVAVAEAFESVLRREQRLLVFPEGTRSADGQLKAFKSGAFHAAVKADRPVVPIAIEGTFSLLSRHEADMDSHARRQVFIRIAEPLRADATLPEQERVNDLRDRTRAEVVALLEGIRREGNSPPS